MMQMRDWISGIIGAVLFLLGLAPIIGWLKTDFLPTTIITWIIAIAGFVLLQDAIVEITNSNVLGWVTLIVALLVLLVGVLPILHSFGIGPEFFGFKWLGRTIYNIIFMLEGAFLMLATFAREL